MSIALPPVGATSSSLWPAVPSQQQQQINAAQLADAIGEITRQQQLLQREITAAARSRSDDELRGWLMVLATLTAGVTYSAALNPPGGVWQADDLTKKYVAGRPVLLDKFPRQYKAFRAFNVLSFGASLLIIVLSALSSSYNRLERSVLNFLVAADILFLAAAFIAGSWTDSSIVGYVAGFVIVVVLRFVYEKICQADQDN